MSRPPVSAPAVMEQRLSITDPKQDRDTAAAAGPVEGDRRRTHVLTIALEDYFHVTPLEAVVPQDRWYRFEMRLEASTRRTLDLLDACSARATFFVLGWVADVAPELVREVADGVTRSPAKDTTTGASGDRPGGLPRGSRSCARGARAGGRPGGPGLSGGRALARPADLWALDVLAEVGYAYDSSIKPVFRGLRARAVAPVVPHRPGPAAARWGFPLSSHPAARTRRADRRRQLLPAVPRPRSCGGRWRSGTGISARPT